MTELKHLSRWSEYVDDSDKYGDLQTWYEDIFIPTLDKIDIDCISWERAVKKTGSRSIRDFYNRCLLFNG